MGNDNLVAMLAACFFDACQDAGKIIMGKLGQDDTDEFGTCNEGWLLTCWADSDVRGHTLEWLSCDSH